MMYRSEDGGGIIVNPEEVSRLRALGEINNWIDTKLGKYVRNELGTPEDPVRALAERGVLHFTPQGGAVSAHTNREMLGMPTEPTATSPLAQSWEDVADATIRGGPYLEKLPMSVNEAQIDIPETLRQLGGEYAVQNPDALAYELNRGMPLSEGLGFRHLIDELRNATDPDSGLPRSLQLSPEKLQKVTVPQAVELVDKINKWRAEQKVAADLKRSKNAATVEYKAYPQPNYFSAREPGSERFPGGFFTPDRAAAQKFGESFGKPVQGYVIEPRRTATEADVENVARRLGIYDEGVPADQYLTQGPEQIYDQAPQVVAELRNLGFDSARLNDGMSAQPSLVALDPSIVRPALDNPKGLRWVELRTPEITSADQLTPEAQARYKSYLSTGVGEEAALRQAAKYDESLAESLKYEGEVMGHCVGGYCPDVQEGRSRIYSLRDAKGEPHVTVEVRPGIIEPRMNGDVKLPDEIVQIKGKANRAPKDEYLPFVQDFVRSGRWSSVGDIRNTGLIEIDPSSDLARNIRAAGGEPPKFVTQQELTEWLNWWRLRQYGDPTNGFKKGGAVKRKASDLPGYGEGSAGALSDVVRGFMGEKPAEPTNPSELFRLAQALGAFPPVAGAVGAVKRPAGAAAALRELLRTEAPAQSAAAREALRRAYRTGHEHSVVGLTEAGVPGEVVTSGNRTRVIPSAADVSRAVSDPQRRAIVDFHTHPSDVSGLRVSPSADDVAFYADYERGAWPRTLKTFIASPPSTGGGRASTAYSFFETDVPRRVYDKNLFKEAELELQNAGRLGRFDRVRRDPAFAAAFESGAVDLQDLLGEAAPLLLLERRAAQGAGRQRLDLGANAVAPNAELRDFYEMIREPAQEFLKKNKLKKGGAVKIETNPTLMADELLFKGHKRR